MLLAAALIPSIRAQRGDAFPKEAVHDWTQTAAGEDFVESWADVKAPGGGRRYLVGTATVRTTDNTPQFSGFPVDLPASLPAFTLLTGSRQIVILQCIDDSGATVWQRFFHGTTSGDVTRAANARAVSVWPESTEADTRIAICGETYDRQLPGSSAIFPGATATSPTGFIAVFDGGGNLQWTHHVFGASNAQSCAITDVSIRVEGLGEQRREVVTYCGISSHGNPGAGTPLSPVLPFDAGGSTGAVNHGAGQWDGIVGRVLHDALGATTVEFHSIVGGTGQDGFFGLAEIDGFRFVAVGSTVSGPNASNFPFVGTVGGPYSVGSVVYFDALGPRTGLPLTLHQVHQIGSTVGDEPLLHTLARDVLIAWNIHEDPSGIPGHPWHAAIVVGSTDDPAAFSGIAAMTHTGTLQGGTDGFIASYVENQQLNALVPFIGTYVGDSDDDGLTGIQSWNEFGPHFSVAGFSDTDTPGTGVDIVVRSFFLNNAAPVFHPSGSTAPLSGTNELIGVRTGVVLASGVERPAAVGAIQATNAATGVAFDTGPLGDPAGGGVAVDDHGRVTAVGQVAGTDMPTLGSVVRGRDPAPGADGVRAAYDMLPLWVGRTDGTGDNYINFSPQPMTPGGPIPTGGTTPTCALESFGNRIFVSNPGGSLWTTGVHTPGLERMLIDFEGDQGSTSLNPPETNAAIIVSRPTPQFSGTISLAVLQIGIPSPVPVPFDLAEMYGNSAGNLPIFVTMGSFPWRIFRLPLTPSPLPPTQAIAQLLILLSAPVGNGSGCFSQWSASPGMWFYY